MLTLKEYVELQRFAHRCGLGRVWADGYQPRPHRPHVGGCACPRCEGAPKPCKAKPAPKQPWDARRAA